MKEKYKYYFLTFIRFLGDSFFYPFFALYLHSKEGIGEGRIGVLIAIIPFIGLIANPILSKICKNFKILKIVLGIIGILEALLIYLILNVNDFYSLLILTILLALVGSSHYGLQDSLLTIFATNNKMNYSNIRVWGSIAYIFGTAIAGFLIKEFNYDFCFYICSVLFVMASIFYLSVKSAYNEEKKEEKRSFKEVIKKKNFNLYVIFYMLFYGVFKTSNNFYSLLLESRGLSEAIFGYNYAIFVSVEVMLLFLFDRFNKKLNYKRLLGIAVISLSIMVLVNASSLPSTLIIIFSILIGVSWGIVLHVSNKVVVQFLGVKNTTVGTMILDLAYSIIVIICNTSGGHIIEATSYQLFYFILAIIAIIDSVFYYLFVRKHINVNDEIAIVDNVDNN